MRLTITPILTFFLLLFVYTKLAGPIPFSLNSIVTTKTDTFSVSGTGNATAVPDIALVTVGVAAQGTTAKGVQQELNTKMNAVIDAVKKLGIDAKDIQTAQYSINPVVDYQSDSRRITGYQANSTLTVKVREMDKANDVVDSATANGANDVGGVSFGLDDPTQAENEAREMAVAEAKKKAENAAKAAGFSLGKIINYQEGFGGGPIPMMTYDKAALPIAGGGERTQIEPGSNEVNITVTLTYQLN